VNSYWIDISLKGGWVKVFKVKAKSLKHALGIAQDRLLSETTFEATETFETARKNR